MSFDKITVVINTFHSEDRIYECLDSIPKNIKVINVENSDNSSFKHEIEKNILTFNVILQVKILDMPKEII